MNANRINFNDSPDPEDVFTDTRMTLGGHIEELRTHLLRALKGFAIGMVLGLWPLGPWVLGIITDPVEKQLYEFEKRKLARQWQEDEERMKAKNLARRPIDVTMRFKKGDLARLVNPDAPPRAAEGPKVGDKMVKGFEAMLFDLDAIDCIDKDARQDGEFIDLAMQIVDPRALDKAMLDRQVEVKRPGMTTMEITEAFMVYFKVAMFTGLVISSPWVFYHLWMFIAAGLYPNEKKLVNVYLPFSVLLFICGVVLCQFAVMPKAVEAMLWFNEWLGMSADMRLSEWMSFAVMMPVVFGFSFQTPLVMMFLHRVGILSIETFRKHRRGAWFVMAIFAAVITPSVDAMSMLFLWLPMGFLYEFGILLCVWQGKQETLFDLDECDQEEGVQV